ncbi:MAG: hypothetical protein NVS2B17_05130 [Candidatus Velthaea sp.]
MLKFFRALTLGLTFIAASFVQSSPALAGSHEPTLDIQPTLIYATSSNIKSFPGVPGADGNLVLNFSAHLPLAKAVTLSFDHYTNGLIYGSLPRVAIGNQYVSPVLDFRDLIDTFRIDAPIARGINAEIGTSYRHRVCCPGDRDPSNPSPTFYHDNYLNLSYTTPVIASLNNARFTYGITGHASPHFSDSAAAVAAASAAGYSDSKRTELGITQAVTLGVPIDAKNGLSAAGTFTWGAFNYFSNQPIPLYYDIIIVSATKSVNKNLSFTASVDNFVQRPQGYPFSRGNGVNGASLNLGANIHVGN